MWKLLCYNYNFIIMCCAVRGICYTNTIQVCVRRHLNNNPAAERGEYRISPRGGRPVINWCLNAIEWCIMNNETPFQGWAPAPAPIPWIRARQTRHSNAESLQQMSHISTSVQQSCFSSWHDGSEALCCAMALSTERERRRQRFGSPPHRIFSDFLRKTVGGQVINLQIHNRTDSWLI